MVIKIREGLFLLVNFEFPTLFPTGCLKTDKNQSKSYLKNKNFKRQNLKLPDLGTMLLFCFPINSQISIDSDTVHWKESVPLPFFKIHVIDKSYFKFYGIIFRVRSHYLYASFCKDDFILLMHLQ
jgi:hypothetical protein